jgi:hypothetical protein
MVPQAMTTDQPRYKGTGRLYQPLTLPSPQGGEGDSRERVR